MDWSFILELAIVLIVTMNQSQQRVTKAKLNVKAKTSRVLTWEILEWTLLANLGVKPASLLVKAVRILPCAWGPMFILCARVWPLNDASMFKNAKPTGYLVLILKSTRRRSCSFLNFSISSDNSWDMTYHSCMQQLSNNELSFWWLMRMLIREGLKGSIEHAHAAGEHFFPEFFQFSVEKKKRNSAARQRDGSRTVHCCKFSCRAPLLRGHGLSAHELFIWISTVMGYRALERPQLKGI